MEKLSCKDIKLLLSAYIDDEVTPSERQAIKEHLASCEDCHNTLFNLLKVSDMLKQEYKSSHDICHKDFSKQIMARVRCNSQAIASDMNKDSKVKRGFSLNSSFIKHRALAVAIVLLSLISVLSLGKSSSKQEGNIAASVSAPLNLEEVPSASASIKELEADPLARFIVDHYSASYSENIPYTSLGDGEIIEEAPFNGGVRGVTTVNFNK